ncbi:MAG TPA: DUF6220 domain-containing protein [Candidatus Limnocylindrales bacterium]|nr:DUF6220 domain-containing protein [Candidatus Limnocylindrales bacterium]
MQIWRYLLAATSVLFLVGVLVQVFLAGMGLSRLGDSDIRAHIDFGYTLSLAPVVPLVLTWPARAGGRTAILCVALLVDTFVQTLLPLARDSVPFVAALHPVNALLVFGLSLLLARRAVALASGSASATSQT